MGSAASQLHKEKPSVIDKTTKERGERESSTVSAEAYLGPCSTTEGAALGNVNRSVQDDKEEKVDESRINKYDACGSDDTTQKVKKENSVAATALLDATREMLSTRESSATCIVPAVPIACSPVPYDNKVDRERRRGPKLVLIARRHRRENSTSEGTPRGAPHALSANVEMKEDETRGLCSSASPIEMAHSPTYFSPRDYLRSFPHNNPKAAFFASFSSTSTFSSPRPLQAKPFCPMKSMDNTPLALCSASSNTETTAIGQYASLMHRRLHTHGDVAPASASPASVYPSCCCTMQQNKCPSSLDYQQHQHQNEHQININVNLGGFGASSSWCAITNSSTETAATVPSPTDTDNKDNEGQQLSPSPLHPFVAFVGAVDNKNTCDLLCCRCGLRIKGKEEADTTPFGFSSLDSAGKIHPRNLTCNCKTELSSHTSYCACVHVAGLLPSCKKDGNAGCCVCDSDSVSQLANARPQHRPSPRAADVCSTTRVFHANTSPKNTTDNTNYGVHSCETAGQMGACRADNLPTPPRFGQDGAETFGGSQRRQTRRVLSPIRITSSMSATFPQPSPSAHHAHNCSPSPSPKSAVVHQCEFAATKDGTLHHHLHLSHSHTHNQPRDHRRYQSNNSDGAVAGLPEFPFVATNLPFSSFSNNASTTAVSPKNTCNSRGEGGGSDGRGARSIILSGSRRSVRVVCNDEPGTSSEDEEDSTSPHQTRTEKEDARRALHLSRYGVGSFSLPFAPIAATKQHQKNKQQPRTSSNQEDNIFLASRAKVEVTATEKLLGNNTALYAGAISLCWPRGGSGRCSFSAGSTHAFGEDIACPLQEASVRAHNNNIKGDAVVCKSKTNNEDDDNDENDDSSSTCSEESALIFSDDEDLSSCGGSSLGNVTTRVAPRTTACGMVARCMSQPTAGVAPTLAPPRRGTFLRGFDMDSAAVMSLLSSASPPPPQCYSR